MEKKLKDELKQIRAWGKEELAEKLKEAQNELMNLRFKNASGQLKITSQIGRLKRKIGRINTIISEQVGSNN